MSEMSDERLKNRIEEIEIKRSQGHEIDYIFLSDLQALYTEIHHLREAAKGQAIIADQAGRRIRELEKENEHLKELRLHRMEKQNQKMKEVLRMFFRTAWQGDLDGGWVQDMGVEHGFLNEEIYDYEKHGDIDGLEPGDVIYTLSDEIIKDGEEE